VSRVLDLDRLSPADLRHLASLREDAQREQADALREHAGTDVRALLQLEALGEMAPSLVSYIIQTDYKRLIENRPTIGAPDAAATMRGVRARRLAMPDPLEVERMKDREDPERLVRIVREIARFTDDVDLVIDAAVEHAEKCGISEAAFGPVIARAARELMQERRRRVSIN